MGSMMKLTARILHRPDGGFAAECRLLPGCLGSGRTPDDACRALLDAARGYIAAATNSVSSRLVACVESADARG